MIYFGNKNFFFRNREKNGKFGIFCSFFYFKELEVGASRCGRIAPRLPKNALFFFLNARFQLIKAFFVSVRPANSRRPTLIDNKNVTPQYQRVLFT
jgi:hypothetical protein